MPFLEKLDLRARGQGGAVITSHINSFATLVGYHSLVSPLTPDTGEISRCRAALGRLTFMLLEEVL
jgi:hypothetical protein